MRKEPESSIPRVLGPDTNIWVLACHADTICKVEAKLDHFTTTWAIEIDWNTYNLKSTDSLT